MSSVQKIEGNHMKGDSHETRIALLEQSIINIDRTLERIDKGFDEIDKRLDKLENNINSSFDRLEKRIDRLDNRLWTTMFLVPTSVVGVIVAKIFNWI